VHYAAASMTLFVSNSTFTVLDPFVPPAIPRVRTARLLLREPRRTDFPRSAENAADPEAQAFGGGPRPARDAWRFFLASAGYWTVQGMGWWAVEEPAIGPVGAVGVFVRESSPDVEIGWTIHRPHWGKGYAAEAARAALDFTVRQHGVRRIVAYVDEGNERSVRVARKIGMRCEREADPSGEEVALYAFGEEAPAVSSPPAPSA
jgi:[ribosomal protein S5]-alanine N-acetyltransferase